MRAERRVMIVEVQSVEIVLEEVRKGNYQKEMQLMPSFFKDSSYFGCNDLFATLKLKAQYSGGDKASGGVYSFDIDLSGEGTFCCTRCLQDCRLPVSYFDRLEVFMMTDKEESLDGDVWHVLLTREKLCLDDFLCDSLYFSFPMSPHHGILGSSLDDCDPNMLTLLNKNEKGRCLSDICAKEFVKLTLYDAQDDKKE